MDKAWSCKAVWLINQMSQIDMDTFYSNMICIVSA